MNTTPPTECPAWAKLAAHAEGWKGGNKEFTAAFSDGLAGSD
jgi:hypothetical protein